MLGLSQQQLDQLIGVTYQQAHKYEPGSAIDNEPYQDTLSQPARALASQSLAAAKST